jgi:hypothetical protein
MGEQACPSPADSPAAVAGSTANQSAPPSAALGPELWMVEDPKDGPRPPEHLNLDSAALKSKFGVVQRRSTLVNFRFGTSDYDRWAVVYGRVERRTLDAPHPDSAHKPASNLVFRGSSVIIVITPGEW